MIYALIEKYQITTMICDSKGNGTHDAELQILAGVVFFLKLHYPLCNLSDHDTSDSNLKKIGLPTLAELEGEWKDKVDSYFQYKDMPLRSTFPWSELDSYLKYCDSAGLRQPSQQLKLEAGSSDRLLLYPTNDPPPWRAVVLSVEQMDQLAAMRKFWTDTAIGNLEELPESYLRILQISCTIVDWAPEYLLKRINKRFEGRLQL